MTVQQAAALWQQRQTALLAASYTQAWRQGAGAYRSQQATPAAGATATTGLPAQPNAQAMSRALSPALQSIARMAATIATIVPTAAQIAAAGSAIAAIPLAIKTYLATSAWLLAGGASVVWAGEQAGYAETAKADGALLQWELDPNPTVDHCADCPALAALPPMPLDWWPTLPGQGATACSVGCKCSMRAVAGTQPALTAEQHELLARLANRQPVLVAA